MSAYARSLLSNLYSNLTQRAMQPVEPPLTAEDIESFRRLLLHLRVSISAEVARLQRDNLGGEGRAGRSGGHADSASALPDDSWIQNVSERSIATKRALLRDIDGALDRMARQVYGVCIQDGRPIARERLEEVPWAKYCETCAASDRA